VEVIVEEGRLVEVPTAGATGMERRAFGEFVGPRGELASYAFGWATDTDPRAGRMTIGIGAGNPGGGSFHALVFVHDDGHAFALDDEPFERVPEGGPHLTADQARAHDDLPFVWAVADHVMTRDRRACRCGTGWSGRGPSRPRRSSSARSRSCSCTTTPTTTSGS
jgi:hypothetical protein